MEFIDKDINAVGGNAITDDIIKKIFPNHNTNYGKDRKKLWNKLKKDNKDLYKRMQDFLSKEQKHLCCYCMKRLSANDTTIEHVIPKSINDVVSFDEYKQNISYNIDFELSDLYLTTPHHAVPPYPHIYAYKNLTASCKGVNFIEKTKTKSQSCNNFRLSRFITPMMFYPNIKQECQYYEDGEVIWINEPNQNPAIVALGLNDDMLKMIRRMWFGIQKHPDRPTLSTLEKYTDDERDEMINFLNGILSENGLTISDREILNTFNNETYWNIFLKYDYFLNVTPSVKPNI